MSTANPKRTRLDAPLSAQESSGVQEPTYTLTGLSEADLGLLADALHVLNDHATKGERYEMIMDMIHKLYTAYDN